MIVNFTDNFQFHTQLQLNIQNIEIVDRVKILGTVFTNQLKWTENCNILIRKVNNRMQLLRTVRSFGSTHTEMVHLWIVFCRSVLEQSCVLWDGGLTQENREDLERTQKTLLYKVTHAYTERFRFSPIVTMQRMLNDDRRNNP